MEKLINLLKEEWIVIKGAPFSFALLLTISSAIVWSVVNWHYSERISILENRNTALNERIATQVERLGINRPDQTAYAKLTNQEFKTAASKSLGELRNMRSKEAN